jgi:enoyl-CoA hydratase/carnithine racemase
MDGRSPLVEREDDAHVTTLTLARPKQRNALSAPLLRELLDHLRRIDAEPRVRVVVLAGQGPAFSAGHDLREIQANADPQFRAELFQLCSAVMLAIVGLRQPVIAKVHGIATAAGCQLVASCDLALAAESARFATPGVDIGLFCSTPMVALTRNVGAKHAMEMLLTGLPIDAPEAERIGLVNRVVPDAELAGASGELAERLARGPFSLGLIKRALNQSLVSDLGTQLQHEEDLQALAMASGDFAEGVTAFRDKRPAVFRGC